MNEFSNHKSKVFFEENYDVRRNVKMFSFYFVRIINLRLVVSSLKSRDRDLTDLSRDPLRLLTLFLSLTVGQREGTWGKESIDHKGTEFLLHLQPPKSVPTMIDLDDRRLSSCPVFSRRGRDNSIRTVEIPKLNDRTNDLSLCLISIE